MTLNEYMTRKNTQSDLHRGFKIKCDILRDLVPFAQFKKREKHPWRSVTFNKVVGSET